MLSLSVKPACPWHTQSIDNGTNKNVKLSSGRAQTAELPFALFAFVCSLCLPACLSISLCVSVSVCCQRIKATAVCIEAHANKEMGTRERGSNKRGSVNRGRSEHWESDSMKTGNVGGRGRLCVATPL